MYISRCAELLLREEEPLQYVCLRGTGNAIAKAVRTSDILR
jgi:DNA-binding protein